MAWVTLFWKKIRKNRVSFVSALSIMALVFLSILYLFAYGFGKGDDFNRNKLFRIARDPNLYPISLLGKERNLSAFVNELIFKIANDTNLNIQIINVPFSVLFEKLDYNEVDAILSTVVPSASGRSNFLFSNPLFELGPVLIARQQSDFSSINDLVGKNVGVKRGDSIFFDQTRLGIFFVPYDSYIEALEDLEKYKIEGVLMPQTAAYTYTQVFYPGKLKVATPPLREEGLRIQATKSVENHYLIETFNKALKASVADGSYDIGLIKWGLLNPRSVGQEP